MEDTSADVRALVNKTVMSLTAEERLLMCAEMFETVKEFAAERVPAGLSEKERKKAIFKLIYGFEMPEPNQPPDDNE